MSIISLVVSLFALAGVILMPIALYYYIRGQRTGLPPGAA